MRTHLRPAAVGSLAAILSLLVTFSFVTPADAAFLNSLRGFDRTRQGWSGSLDGSYGASGGNSEESIFSGAARAQLRDDRHTWRLIAAGNRTTTRGVETAKSAMGHLRHNYRLSDQWATLVFLQAQQNPFQRLDSRYLVGFGARYNLIDDGGVLWSAGAAQMFESERIQDEEGHTNVQRLSAFTSVETELREGIVLDAMVFYQPRWADFSDWRLFSQIELDIELNGVLSLFTGAMVQHNAKPPEGVEQTDWTTTTGFRAKF
jgi:putative salt-induced outer membrane protein YdiY